NFANCFNQPFFTQNQSNQNQNFRTYCTYNINNNNFHNNQQNYNDEDQYEEDDYDQDQDDNNDQQMYDDDQQMYEDESQVYEDDDDEEEDEENQKGLTKEEINSIPCIIYTRRKIRNKQDKNANFSTKTSCSICINDYSEGEYIKILPCSHQFHKNCIDKWFQDNSNCVVCKQNVIQ
ncbi:ring finger lim domain interacting, partial [Ichthyophthirius multifiliis]